MSGWKKGATYLVLVLLLGGFCLLLAQPLIADCRSVLTTGRGARQYVAAAAGETGELCVLGQDEAGFWVVRGDASGQAAGQWRVTLDAAAERCRAALLYPDTRNAVYLGLYVLPDEEEGAAELRLYRLADGGKTQTLLLRQEGTGETAAEQMASLRLSPITKTDGVISFALLEGDRATVCRVSGDGSGLERGESRTIPGLRSALVLSDGRLAASAEAGLTLDGGKTFQPRENQVITDLKQAGAGLYALDRAGLEVFYTDLLAPDQSQTVLTLDKADYDLDSLTSVSLLNDGSVLLLLDGGTLLLDRGSGVTDLSGLLHRPGWQCGLILAGLALAVLALAALLWYPLCQVRAMQLPLLLRWGGLLTAAGVLCAAALLRWGLQPAQARAAAGQAQNLVGGVTRLLLEDAPPEDPDLPARLTAALSGGLWDDPEVSVARVGADGAWRLTADSGGAPAGIRAELLQGFDRAQALAAREQGFSAGTFSQDGQTRYRFCWHRDGSLLTVSVPAARLLAETEAAYAGLARGVWAITALVLALAVAVLAWISLCLGRVTRGMSRLASGQAGARVRLATGDELEGLARSLNSLGETLDGLKLRQQELARSYLRFVPERMLALLGKQSLDEVDKHTFAVRSMAAMTVWFTFPQRVYEQSGRELFDHLNEIIERTAALLTRNGGTVFNFAYNGYDAVFEGGALAAVSTAVAIQQEILAVNQEREIDGRPLVTLRIALDQGSVVMGVVGDEAQMSPTAISSSFSAVRQLIGLCGLLDANILCTDAVAAAAQEYGVRYMGKCADGGQVLRTYEIYDGDPYQVRRVKSLTSRQFSEGVYALYSRDFAGAKRIFLDLVHHNTGDGGARYYLYLADQLEKNPDRDLLLNSR